MKAQAPSAADRLLLRRHWNEATDETFAVKANEAWLGACVPSVQVYFSPRKPLELECDIAVTVKGQAQWRFRVRFQATAPSPDDTILIECTGSQQASVLFYLTSCQREPAAFSAAFRDAAPELCVEPKDGILQPRGSGGTAFKVTYTPSESGKAVTNVLRIETQEDFWSYTILGRQADSQKATSALSDESLLVRISLRHSSSFQPPGS